MHIVYAWVTGVEQQHCHRDELREYEEGVSERLETLPTTVIALSPPRAFDPSFWLFGFAFAPSPLPVLSLARVPQERKRLRTSFISCRGFAVV